MAAGASESEQRLPLVRRGYDPYEVQQLIGQLQSEIGALQRANAELRRRIDEFEHAGTPLPITKSLPDPEVVVDDARRLAERMLEQAAFEAAELRRSARLEADQVMSDANRHRDEVRLHHRTIGEQLQAAHVQISALLDHLGRAMP